MAPLQTQNGDLPNSEHHSRLDVSLLDYFKVIIKHRKFVGCFIGAAFLFSIVVSFLLPKMYAATARVLPPQENNRGLASLISNSDNPLSGLISNQTPAALYVGIMKSRSVADALNQKFKLKELYGLKYIEDVYSTLESRSIIDISKKDQLISVTVKDRDPRRAAEIANAYVDMLDQFNRTLVITQGKRKRIFLEDRLNEVRADLESAEMDLKAFQEKYHLVSMQEQAKVAIEGAAEIKGQIIAAQTELEVLKQFGTEQQIEAVMLKTKIEELAKQLNSIEQGKKLETGEPNSSAENRGADFYIPFVDLPRLGMELMRLTREAKIQEKLFELLTTQYELAQIEEAKDVDTIQVLDRAVAPEKKLSPNRRKIVAIVLFLSAVSAVLTAFLLEYFGKSKAELSNELHHTGLL